MSEEKVIRGDAAGNGDENETWKRSIAGEYGPSSPTISRNLAKVDVLAPSHLFSQT